MTTIGIVVGNPKPRSRTWDVAEAVATAAARAAGCGDADRFALDLADLGPLLFDRAAPSVQEAVDGLAACSLAVVASPTYKASYTGLLKSYLDWFSTTGLSGVTVIPVMVGAGLQHALAVEVHLRPVLVEIGATVPTRGLYVTEDQLGGLDDVISPWLLEAAPLLRHSVQRP